MYQNNGICPNKQIDKILLFAYRRTVVEEMCNVVWYFPQFSDALEVRELTFFLHYILVQVNFCQFQVYFFFFQ